MPVILSTSMSQKSQNLSPFSFRSRTTRLPITSLYGFGSLQVVWTLIFDQSGEVKPTKDPGRSRHSSRDKMMAYDILSYRNFVQCARRQYLWECMVCETMKGHF